MNYSTTSTPDNDTECSRETEDTWTGQTWKVAAVSVGLEELHVNGAPPQFWLERVAATGPAVYALKPTTAVELPQCFAPSVLLTQYGAIEPGPLKCTKRLPTPFVKPHKPYWDALEEVLGDDRDLRRLEGTIQMSDGPHKIRMFQVNNILADDRTLLVIDIKSLASRTNSDGSAVGHN